MTRRNGNRLWAVGGTALFAAVLGMGSGRALAQVPPNPPPKETPPPQQQQALPPPPVEATPSQTEAADLYSVNATGKPEKVLKGLFAETSVGGFFTVGGQGGYSNFVAFLEIGIGYDITKDLAISLRFQLSPSEADCYAANNDCPAVNTDTFTITTGNLAVSYLIPVGDRLYVPARLMGGIALLNPNPDRPPPTSPTAAQGGAGSIVEPDFGVASGIEWATPFDHFIIDAEVSWNFILGINASAISIYPTIRYTF